MSSVAYATEEILLLLVLAGTRRPRLTVPIALAIAALLVIVAISYQQTIHAYPSGGGSYIVARTTSAPIAGLVAAAALLVDYVLTVSVSVAAGVAALTSAFPALPTHTRRARRRCSSRPSPWPTSAASASPAGSSRCPTYLFIVAFGVLIVVGPLPLADRRRCPRRPPHSEPVARRSR